MKYSFVSSNDKKESIKMRSEFRTTIFCKMDVVGLTLIVAYEKSFPKVLFLIIFDTYFT